ncbi:cysteine proteinase inhibitor 5-like [Salvia hispanica]|uniref:cysteine proteinase inhibitor 5-like n=1 Tax=Salvia hispanica TaxID=49212 RepID=UPI002008F97A|nr:cysteine proteinase inhibitor 5-like [Salvia hispanica]
MASSMTMTTSFYGGAVATKPATATTRPSQLAVRASMDFEKVVATAAETTNTRRGLVLAGMAAVAASSVAKAATAETIVGGYTDQDPTKREYFQIATFAVSEYNKQKNLGFILESVFRAQTQVVSGVNYKVAFTVRDNRPGNPSSNFEAVVYSKAAPTLLELISFDPLLK